MKYALYFVDISFVFKSEVWFANSFKSEERIKEENSLPRITGYCYEGTGHELSPMLCYNDYR